MCDEPGIAMIAMVVFVALFAVALCITFIGTLWWMLYQTYKRNKRHGRLD